MPEYLPTYKPGNTITLIAGTVITGGQLLAVGTDGRVVPSMLNSTSTVGVAGHDAVAGDPVTIHAGGVQELTASGAITAGALVTADDNGAVKANATPATGALIGIAVGSATGGRVRVQVNR